MGFQNRWDFILDKAMRELKRDDVDLLSSWVECLAKAHQKFRLDLGQEQTQQLAELDWWKYLFAEQPFPESSEEWQQDALSDHARKATSLTARKILPTSVAVSGLRGYTSCWEAMKLKALDEGNSLDDIMMDYRMSIMGALKDWLRDYGQPFAMFRAELHMWRDLFPDEFFPGINPISGERNWTRGRDLRRRISQTEKDRDETHQANPETFTGTQSIWRRHEASSQTVQANSPANDSQGSESMDIDEESLDEGVHQSREFSKAGTTGEEDEYRSEGRSRSRSRSPDVFTQRTELRQRSPLRDPTNPVVRGVPSGPRAMTTGGGPFSFRGAYTRGGSGGFQKNRGAIRGADQAMRGNHYRNTTVAYTGGRVVTPLGPSCFPNYRAAAPPLTDVMPSTAGNAMTNATCTPEELRHARLPPMDKQ